MHCMLLPVPAVLVHFSLLTLAQIVLTPAVFPRIPAEVRRHFPVQVPNADNADTHAFDSSTWTSEVVGN